MDNTTVALASVTVTTLGALLGGIWKFASLHGEIKTMLALVEQRLDSIFEHRDQIALIPEIRRGVEMTQKGLKSLSDRVYRNTSELSHLKERFESIKPPRPRYSRPDPYEVTSARDSEDDEEPQK